jgi:hypothetical protein
VANGALTLWSTTLNGAVNVSTPVSPSGGVTVTGAETNQALQGLEAVSIGGVARVFAVFQNGGVYNVDPATGAASLFASLLNTTKRFESQAMAVDPVGGLLFAIVQSPSGAPARDIVTLNLATGAFTSVALQKMKGYAPSGQVPFEMTWLPAMGQLLVFVTGALDQVGWLDFGFVSGRCFFLK